MGAAPRSRLRRPERHPATDAGHQRRSRRNDPHLELVPVDREPPERRAAGVSRLRARVSVSASRVVHETCFSISRVGLSVRSVLSTTSETMAYWAAPLEGSRGTLVATRRFNTGIIQTETKSALWDSPPCRHQASAGSVSGPR